MRFALAIVTFVVAAALIALGFAMRTVLAPPDRIVASTTVTGGRPFTVIDGSVLNANGGQQTLVVQGGSREFVAYGRTPDVLAWLGHEPYAQVRYTAGGTHLSSRVVYPPAKQADQGADGTPSTSTPAPTPSSAPATTPSPAPSATAGGAATTDTTKTVGANPAGSDLWLQQFTGSSAQVTRLAVPDNVSVIIASDGVRAAPSDIRIQWPLSRATPLVGPLISAGVLLGILGIVFYIWALRGLRRSRGPRRSGPRMPKPPRARRYRPQRQVPPSAGRRSIRRRVIAVPVLLAGALALTGCSSQYWPALGSTPSATATPTPIATTLPGQGKQTELPAVTKPQLQGIVDRIAGVTKNADATSNAELLASRYAGPALALRKAYYAIHAKDSTQTAPPTVTDSALKLALPQATDDWPRAVLAVSQNTSDAKAAPVALLLEQDSPRDNYQVDYDFLLQADVTIPKLAPATVGTAVIPPNSKLLVVPPDQVAADYGDILMNGTDSKFAKAFDTAHDQLLTQVGPAFKAKQKASLPSTATMTFTNAPGGGDTVAMATNDSGALVATSWNESTIVKPTDPDAQISVGGAIQALSGISSSKTGIQTTYNYQLLFYVPPAGSSQKIELLGFATGPVSASEVQ